MTITFSLQRRDVARRLELADHDLAAPEQEVVHQRIEVDRRLDAHFIALEAVLRRERMLAGTEHHAAAPCSSGGRIGLGLDCGFGCGGSLSVGWYCLIHETPYFGPIRSCSRRYAIARRLPTLRVPRRRAQLVVDETRRRRPPGQRHVRGRVGRHRRRVDRDVEAVTLQLARGGQADDAGSEDGGLALGMRQREIGRHRRRAPRQRHARAAVTEVVDERLAVELVGLAARSPTADAAAGRSSCG